MTAPSFWEEVVIVRLSSRQSDIPVKEVPSTRALAQLLARATLVNNEARRRGYEKSGFDISFKSMLLAFLISDDPWSRSFKPYVQAKTASVDELLKERHFQGWKEFEELDSHANGSDAELELAAVRRQTEDGELLVDAARELCKETPPQDADTPLDVRHLIGAYIYNPPDRSGSSDREKLDSWGYDRLRWSNAFLAQIAKLNSAELEFWKDIHVRTFSIPPEFRETQGPSTQTAPPTIPSAAGYISDSVDAEATDHLDIEREVENIAYVLTSKRVTPPLSLGLFGDWGSGKSFFMTKLEKLTGKRSGGSRLGTIPHSYGASLASDGRRGARSRRCDERERAEHDGEHHQNHDRDVLAHDQPAASALRLRLRVTNRSRRWSRPHRPRNTIVEPMQMYAAGSRSEPRSRTMNTYWRCCVGSTSGIVGARPGSVRSGTNGATSTNEYRGLCQKAIWSSSSPSGLGNASPPIS